MILGLVTKVAYGVAYCSYGVLIDPIENSTGPTCWGAGSSQRCPRGYLASRARKLGGFLDAVDVLHVVDVATVTAGRVFMGPPEGSVVRMIGAARGLIAAISLDLALAAARQVRCRSVRSTSWG